MEKILDFFKTKMRENFSNSEIFNIFKRNKRIVLFLFEDEIITIDEHIVSQFLTPKFIEENYPQYFMPEIKKFLEEKHLTKYDKTIILQPDKFLITEMKKELPENFYQKRKKGENDDHICQMIQNDSIEDFVAFFNKNNYYSLKSSIKSSIYETNSFLIKNTDTTLIEYSAFYGSMQIFKYLISNEVELTPRLWLYAIHGQNVELIQILEEKEVEPYEDSLKESIKCHHNNFFGYIQDNYFKNDSENLSDISIYDLKYYNFGFMEWKYIEKLFFYLCKYDYYFLVDILFKKKNIDINKKEIQIPIFISFEMTKISIKFQ